MAPGALKDNQILHRGWHLDSLCSALCILAARSSNVSCGLHVAGQGCAQTECREGSDSHFARWNGSAHAG